MTLSSRYVRRISKVKLLTDDPTSLLNFLDDPLLLQIFPRQAELQCGVLLGKNQDSLPLTTFSHDCRMPPITEVQHGLRFYGDNYELISQHHLTPQTRIILGNANHRKCRFCGGQKPAVSFRKKAHVIPELLGNKSLFSTYECDSCNSFFGNGIDNDFGNWSKPMRTLARINGKRGFPTIKQRQGQWRIEATSNSNLSITSYEKNPAITMDEENNEITFKLQRDSYTPVAILKAFVKMGIGLLPDSEVSYFKDAIDWIRDQDHTNQSLLVPPVIYTFVSGPVPNTLISTAVLRRKKCVSNVPYATFILSYANEVFQVFLPCPKQDSHLFNTSINLPRFPHPSDERQSTYPPPQTKLITFAEGYVVKNEVVPLTMSFGSGGRVS